MRAIFQKTNLVVNCCIVFAAVTLSSCGKSSPETASEPVNGEGQSKAATATARQIAMIGKLQTELSMLSIRVNNLESGAAQVPTEDGTFGVAHTIYGAFTVSVKSVTPFLDGYKVKLQIGNLTSATFNGAKVSVIWGPPFDDQHPNAADESRSKDFEVTTKLFPGTYNTVEVALTPAKPDAVKNIEVNLDLKQMLMREN